MLLSLPRIHVAPPSAFLLLPSPVRKQNSGGFNPFEKYDFVSWDDENPNIWKVIKAMLQSPPTRTVLGSCPWSDKPRFPDFPKWGFKWAMPLPIKQHIQVVQLSSLQPQGLEAAGGILTSHGKWPPWRAQQTGRAVEAVRSCGVPRHRGMEYGYLRSLLWYLAFFIWYNHKSR